MTHSTPSSAIVEVQCLNAKILITNLKKFKGRQIRAFLDEIPTTEEVSSLVSGGVSNIRVPTTEFSPEPEFLNFLRLLRDSMEFGLNVEWFMNHSWPVNCHYFYHLPPPCGGFCCPLHRQTLDAWTTNHRYGQLYWRRGNTQFILVRDNRKMQQSWRYELDTQEELQTVMLCQAPYHEDNKSLTKHTDILEELREINLVFTVGNWNLFLPYRLRRWPTPAYSI